MSIVLNDLVQYTYKFNVKAIPEIDPSRCEPAPQTVKICILLFNALGAQVSLNDIDYLKLPTSKHHLRKYPTLVNFGVYKSSFEKA